MHHRTRNRKKACKPLTWRNREDFLPQWRELPQNASYNVQGFVIDAAAGDGYPPCTCRINAVKSQEQNAKRHNRRKTWGQMGRIFKVIVILLILAVLAVIGYAYIGDMAPRQEETSVDVTLPDQPAAQE
ncbi:hypothetical protein [Thioclava sp. GXIMD4215]|uniref:hypothetical protein n=1 Tax=Thioclava sp. GXIMD4215 TaxID=3131928 RepID=UPI0032561837